MGSEKLPPGQQAEALHIVTAKFPLTTSKGIIKFFMPQDNNFKLAAFFALGSYIGLIALVNWVYVVAPLVELDNGDIWSTADLMVGFVFVVRDFAQRRVGHHILWGTLAGSVLSWWLATPQIAIASAAAFAVGEMADWALFTFTKRSFAQRILISSLLGCPLDSIVFLTLIERPSLSCVLLMTFSKLLASFIVYYLVRRREDRSIELQSA